MAVPQGHQHRRLLRGPPGDPRPRRPNLSATTITRLKAAWEEDHRGLEQAVAGGQALRLRLGRRRALQHPPGGGPPVHPGADGGDRRGEEGADRHRRRLPGERAIVEGAAAGREGPWAGGRAAPGDRRRGVGVLEGDAAGLGHDEGATLLGAQDWRTCWTSCPRGRQPKAKADAPRDLPGRGKGRGRRRRSTCS